MPTCAPFTCRSPQQAWLLDGLGNWAGFDEDLDGSGWDLEQTRAHSDANEITSTTETTGSAWAGTDHDAAGNMIEMPAAHDPTKVVYAIYDAWNRLAELNMPSGSGYIQYHWDGMGRRVVVERYGEALEEATHFYYSIGHQILEVRVDGTSTSDLAEQYVWGARYVDELILRDRDTTDDGSVDERLYALQDANFNVVAIVDDEGTVVERYRYTPYGQRTVLNANFTVHADPLAGGHAFAIGHQGLHHDGEVSAGLIYNRARMLHPRLGRWLQRESLGYIDGLSLYQYVRSNPLYYIDPTGRQAVALAGQSEGDDDDDGYWWIPDFIEDWWDVGTSLGDHNYDDDHWDAAIIDSGNGVEDWLDPDGGQNREDYNHFEEVKDAIIDAATGVPGTSITGPPPGSVKDWGQWWIEEILGDLWDDLLPCD